MDKPQQSLSVTLNDDLQYLIRTAPTSLPSGADRTPILGLPKWLKLRHGEFRTSDKQLR